MSAPPTVLEIIKKTTDFLQGKGVEAPRLNAEILVGHALGLKRMQLYLQFERELSEPELELIRPLVRRRALREPVQHIVGETDFFGVKLKVDRRSLIPRPETEFLVELTVGRRALSPGLRAQPGSGEGAVTPERVLDPGSGGGAAPPDRVLDLGTGGGAIALALARAWPAAKITAVDVSAPALELARENAAAAGAANVTFVESDWFAGLPADDRYDVIIGNPPYLSAQETAEALPEVREFEPRLALTPEGDGCAALRIILRDAPRFLASGGLLALETGIGHHPELVRLAGEQGLTGIESAKDLTGRDRYLFALGR